MKIIFIFNNKAYNFNYQNKIQNSKKKKTLVLKKKIYSIISTCSIISYIYRIIYRITYIEKFM